MELTTEDRSKAEALTGRICNALVESLDLMSIYLGDKLGWYSALASSNGLTAPQLAAKTGTNARFAREWLEQQATTGILEVDDAAKDADSRRYTLPAGHAAALADPEELFPAVAMAKTAIGASDVMPKIIEAFRTGRGLTWSAYGREGLEAQSGYNRSWLTQQLGKDYLPAVPEIHNRLTANTPAHVADFACGAGWASIAIAKAYPKAKITGFDSDAASVKEATRNAEKASVSDRVKFKVADLSRLNETGAFDAAVVIEAVHDLSRPVEALSSIRRTLKPGAALLVADEKVGESFAPSGDFMERLFYGASIFYCLPTGMVEAPFAGTGAVMRPATLRGYATKAGFKGFSALGLEHPSMRFYLLKD